MGALATEAALAGAAGAAATAGGGLGAAGAEAAALAGAVGAEALLPPPKDAHPLANTIRASASHAVESNVAADRVDRVVKAPRRIDMRAA